MASLEIGKIDYKKIVLQVRQFADNNKILVTSALLLALGATAVIRVSGITQTSVNTVHLNKELESVQTVNFDQESIDKISELQETNIDITSDFTDRNNPFED